MLFVSKFYEFSIYVKKSDRLTDKFFARADTKLIIDTSDGHCVELTFLSSSTIQAIESESNEMCRECTAPISIRYIIVIPRLR